MTYSNERIKKTYLHNVLILACLSILASPLEGTQNFSTKSLEKPTSFTEVAKQAIPSVVSIQVKIPFDSKQRFFFRGKEYEQEEDPFDFFNDEFFNYFFGGPRKGRGQTQKELQVGQGSGFIVSSDGYIITNGHIVSKAAEINVSLNNGREYKAKLIGADPNSDIAIIKIETEGLPYLKLGNSDDLEVGQWVMAIGNPLGLQASVTTGVVSAKGRNGLDLARIEDFIQTDAAINRGNSGGPLLDLNGEVIGMNTAIVTNMGSGGYMGIGFAIPSNLIEYIAKQLVESGSVIRGFIGVSLQQINQDLANAFGLDKIEGALIAEVTPNSPAEKAGLKQGDIIVEQEGKAVSQIGHLRNQIALKKPGSKIDLTVLREGKRVTLPITIGTYPDEEEKAISLITREDKLGIEVETLTPELAERLGLKENGGILVKKVIPGSPAAWAGIQKGTLILAVNRKQVKSSEEFEALLKEIDLKKPILLLIKKGGQVHFLSLKVD